MSLEVKLNERRRNTEVVYEGFGKINQEVKLGKRRSIKKNEEEEEEISKNLPFFINRKKRISENYDFMMNVSEDDTDVQQIADILHSYLNISESIGIRLSLLYKTKQYYMFKNYLIAIKDVLEGFHVLKVTRSGKLQNKKLYFNCYHMNIIGSWSKKILLYDEIIDISIGSSCTPELRIYENKFKDIEKRTYYVVLRTKYRDYSFLFLMDDEILKRDKNLSVLGTFKKLLKNKKNMNKKENSVNRTYHNLEIQENVITDSTKENSQKTEDKINDNNPKNINNKDIQINDKTDEEIDNNIRNFKNFLLTVLRSLKGIKINMNNEKMKAICKPSNKIYFDKYDFDNKKINSFFLFFQIQLDVCGPEIWFTSKFNDIIFTYKN
ncbi:conserved Plasmodium protein, unknown function [Plasmodium gallinaceum]|uniref:Uncharacterized protein n=1 Tax=Plasmodium gallinaceum TaxID=5849 RepID=A0A1J1GRN3_PLAGA|nr:conserved Plasmodium protein, unknown function [Plasmodium gallinaceum]CRG95192.1 conserved Plasmodium protein, unknown function [Plasmodium gallinaceum]